MVFVIPEGDAAWAEIVVKNVEVSSDAIRCREAGVPTVEDDVFLRQGFWKITNHGNLLKSKGK